MPTWSIIHSRHWKMQIPYLARHCRVLTFDGRGNGRSDRPSEPDAYREEEFAADALAVMDATATERAVVVSLSRGAERSLLLAAEHPERVDRMVFIAPALPVATGDPAPAGDARVRRAARGLHRLGEVEPSLLGRALRGLPRVLLLAVLHRAALDQAARGRRRLGSRDRRRDVGRDSAGTAAPGRGERARAPLADRLSDPRDPRRATTPSAPAHPAHGSPSLRTARSRSSRAPAICPMPATPSRSTCSSATSSVRHRRRAAGCAASRGASARSTSRRRSGSATRSVTRRSRTSCASSIPTSRSTGSRSIRSRRCSRRAASGSTRRAR